MERGFEGMRGPDRVGQFFGVERVVRNRCNFQFDSGQREIIMTPPCDEYLHDFVVLLIGRARDEIGVSFMNRAPSPSTQSFLVIMFLAAPGLVHVAGPVTAFQPCPSDKKSPEPAHESQTAKDAPSQGLPFGLDIDRKREQAPGNKGAYASAKGG